MKHTYKTILAIALMIAIILPAQAKVYLVSAGIADYPGTDHDLTLCAKDAATIQYIYDKNGATTYLLKDSQATRENILRYMKTVFARATGDDIIVFFFSGHGYKGGFVAYDDYLTYADMRQAMASSDCKNKMIFADACYSGKMRQGNGGGSTSLKKYNVMLFLSSRDTETSLEKPTMKNGYFTTALQSGLRGHADANRNRTVTAKELFTYVYKNVTSMTDNRQHPVMWGKFSDDMPVLKW